MLWLPGMCKNCNLSLCIHASCAVIRSVSLRCDRISGPPRTGKSQIPEIDVLARRSTLI